MKNLCSQMIRAVSLPVWGLQAIHVQERVRERVVLNPLWGKEIYGWVKLHRQDVFLLKNIPRLSRGHTFGLALHQIYWGKYPFNLFKGNVPEWGRGVATHHGGSGLDSQPETLLRLVFVCSTSVCVLWFHLTETLSVLTVQLQVMVALL